MNFRQSVTSAIGVTIDCWDLLVPKLSAATVRLQSMCTEVTLDAERASLPCVQQQAPDTENWKFRTCLRWRNMFWQKRWRALMLRHDVLAFHRSTTRNKLPLWVNAGNFPSTPRVCHSASAGMLVEVLQAQPHVPPSSPAPLDTTRSCSDEKCQTQQFRLAIFGMPAADGQAHHDFTRLFLRIRNFPTRA